VLRYRIGEKYEKHMDAFSDKFNTDESKGGQRVATVLMYLSEPEEGRGLHSSTFRLNASAFCGIGGASRGYLGGCFAGCRGSRRGLRCILCHERLRLS
jgi:hypothetical protein